MNIVILDGFTTNPGDLSWDGFRELGNLTVYDRTSPDELLERSIDADVLLNNKVLFNAETLDRLPRLKYIGLFSTGYNVVDLKAAREKNIPVTNIPSYSTESVVQATFAHLLNIASDIAGNTEAVRGGDWVAGKDFCFWNNPLTELSGKTLGIVGLGTIGRRVAQVALAFGMNVVAFGRRLTCGATVDGVRCVDFETLLKISDVVSLHCPLNDENVRFINADRLALMKRGSILINTARGGLLDEQAVADALKSGRLAAFAADVLTTEPPTADNPLLSAPNCRLTAHIAWATPEARSRLLTIAVANLKAFLDGKPQNVVN